MAKVPEVLVVDQDPQMRFEVRQMVKHANLNVAGETSFGAEAVSLAADVTPDVIICALGSPPERSLRTIEALMDALPETPVIAYGKEQDVESVRHAMKVGARDFIAFPASEERILQSVRDVLESEEKRRLRASGQTKAKGATGLVISVFGAKGGVGKSTIAVNLALAMTTKLEQNVALIDADNSFGDIAALLDLPHERNIADLAREIDNVDRDNVTGYLMKHQSGLWVLPAPRDSLKWRSVSPDRFRRALSLISRRFDAVIVDNAAVLNDISLAALEESNLVLWVTSTDFSSINNSLIGLETLQQIGYPESRVRLMLNVNTSDDGVRPAKIEQVLKRKFFWTVPYDVDLRRGGQMGSPAVLSRPDSRGADTIASLAFGLMGMEPRLERKGKSPLRRIFNRSSGKQEPIQVVEEEA